MLVKHLHFSLEKKVNFFFFQSQLFLKGHRMKINGKNLGLKWNSWLHKLNSAL